jgi:hypothetical protein
MPDADLLTGERLLDLTCRLYDELPGEAHEDGLIVVGGDQNRPVKIE